MRAILAQDKLASAWDSVDDIAHDGTQLACVHRWVYRWQFECDKGHNGLDIPSNPILLVSRQVRHMALRLIFENASHPPVWVRRSWSTLCQRQLKPHTDKTPLPAVGYWKCLFLPFKIPWASQGGEIAALAQNITKCGSLRSLYLSITLDAQPGLHTSRARHQDWQLFLDAVSSLPIKTIYFSLVCKAWIDSPVLRKQATSLVSVNQLRSTATTTLIASWGRQFEFVPDAAMEKREGIKALTAVLDFSYHVLIERHRHAYTLESLQLN